MICSLTENMRLLAATQARTNLLCICYGSNGGGTCLGCSMRRLTVLTKVIRDFWHSSRGVQHHRHIAAPGWMLLASDLATLLHPGLQDRTAGRYHLVFMLLVIFWRFDLLFVARQPAGAHFKQAAGVVLPSAPACTQLRQNFVTHVTAEGWRRLFIVVYGT